MNAGDISINLRLDDKDFAISVNNSGKLLRELKQELDKTATGVVTVGDHFSSFTTKLRHTVMTLAAARFAFMDFHDVFLALPISIIKTSGEIERMTALMEGLSKQTTVAGKQLEAISDKDYIFKLAMNSPFEVKALADSFVKLKSVAKDDGQARTWLNSLSEGVAQFGGTSEHMHRATIAIQQMVGKGVVSMEELRQQLGEAVPTAIKSMADGMGMGMAELVKHISKGEVEAVTAVNKMLLQMELTAKGSSARMMKTWEGMFSKAKTAWVLIKKEIGDQGFFQGVKKELGSMLEAFDEGKVSKIAKEVGASLQGFVNDLKIIGEGLKPVWDGFYTTMKGVGAVVQALWADFKMLTGFMKDNAGAVELVTKALMSFYLATKVAAMGTWMAGIVAASGATAAFAKTAANATSVMVAKEVAMKRFGAYAGGVYASTHLATAAQATAFLTAKGVDLNSNITGLIASKAKFAGALAATTSAIRGVGASMLALVGGPIGALVLALGAGISWWVGWARAGEDAIARVKEAAHDRSVILTPEDKQKNLSKIDENQVKVGAITRKLNNKVASGLMSSEGIKALKDERDALLREIAEAKAGIASSDAAKARQDSQKDIGNFRDNIDERIAKIRTEGVNAAAKLTESFGKGTGDSAKNSKALADLRLRSIDEEIAVVKTEAIKLEQLSNATDADKAKLADLNLRLNGADGGDGGLNGARARVLQDSSTPIKLINGKGAPKLKDKLASTSRKIADDLAISTAKLELILKDVRTFDAYRSVAEEEIKKKYDSGGFDFETLGKDGKKVLHRPKFDNSKIQKDIDDLTNKHIIDEAISSIPKVREEARKLEEEAKSIWDSLGTGEYKDKTEKELPIIKTLEALQLRLPAGTEAAREFAAVIDNLKLKSADIMGAKAAEESQKNIDKLKIEIEQLGLTADASLKARHTRELEELTRHHDSILKKEKGNAEAIAGLKEKFAKEDKLLKERQVLESRTPLQKLTEQWKSATEQMKSASASWSNSTVDMIVNFVKTGQLEWRKLAASIVESILKIRIQQTMGGAINSAIDAGVKGLGGLMDAKKSGGQQGGVFDGATESLKGFWKSVTNATDATSEMTKAGGDAVAQAIGELTQDGLKMTVEAQAIASMQALAIAAATAANALGAMTGVGGITGVGGMGVDVGGMMKGFGSNFGTASSYGTNMFSEQTSMLAAQDAAMADGGGGIGSWISSFFADGGIMTEFGSVPLRKYANGGVASMPQLAMFGEGSMPEAYVPLPDGRSIPVTFQGDMGGGVGGSNVAISIIINENGGEKSDQKGDDAGAQNFWKGVADKVKGVVRQEMVEQQRPGGVLYRPA